MTVYAWLQSITSSATKRLPSKPSGSSDTDRRDPTSVVDPMSKEETRPPSPAPGFSEADLLSSVLTRLRELEEKVDALQAKPSEMPLDKEELLNAAVRRVDALEAELISTKKVSPPRSTYIFKISKSWFILASVIVFSGLYFGPFRP